MPFPQYGKRLYGIKKYMTMKKAMILAVAASAAMLSACHTSGKVDNFTINVDAVCRRQQRLLMFRIR